MPTPLQTRYAQAARDAGCPRDQVERFARAGVVLQPRQLAASAAARQCDAEDGPEEVGFGGARGGGKSYWGIAQIGVDDCQRYPGLKTLLLRKVGKSNRENFEDLRRRILMRVPHSYNRSSATLTFTNGSRIIAGHFQNEKDIDAYLGLEYDAILVEEATTLTKKKRDDITTVCRTSKRGWRPRIYYTTNPGGIGHAWFKRELVGPGKRGVAGKSVFVPSTVDDNRFVDRGYKKKLDRLTGWLKRAWRFGDWDIAIGAYFDTFRPEIEGRPCHVVPHTEIFRPIPGLTRIWCSLDYGYAHFTTVYLFCEHDGDVYCLDEHAQRRWLPKHHAPCIEAMLARWGLKLSDLSVFVAGHDCWAQKGDEEGKTIADQYAELGIELTKAKIDRVGGATEILSRLGDPEGAVDGTPIPPTLFISSRCAILIEQLPNMMHDPHRPEDVLKVNADDDGNGGDDAYDGFRYGVMEATGSGGWAAALTGRQAEMEGNDDGQDDAFSVGGWEPTAHDGW